MNATDKIITALTPGSIFNRNGLVFRSLGSLASFTEMEEDEVLALLNAELAELVTCKPSTKGKGILVALTEHIPAEEQDGPVQIAAVPGEPMEAEVPAPGPPIIDEEVGEVAEEPVEA